MPRGGARINAGRPSHRTVKVEECRSIDIRQFQKTGLLNGVWSGTWSWKSLRTHRITAQVALWVGPKQIALEYIWEDRRVYEWVALDRTRCAFGGARAWFRCSGCAGRVAILYLHGGLFRCRRCHDLPYVSQAEDAISRTWLAQQKVECALGPHWTRPPRMHKSTRERLVSKVINIEGKRQDLIWYAIAQHLHRI